MAKISASLLSADFGYLADSIKAAENAGVDEFHFDVMDGHFVPNLTFGPPILEAVKRHATLPIDVHVMERSPEVMIPVLASAGGDIITVHIEGVADIDQTIDIILEAGAQPAVAIRPRTPVSALWPVADRIRRVLVMTVEPGFGGQDFLPDTLPKISEALSMMQTIHSDNPFEIAVDGGIKSATIAPTLNAGATTFISGSSIFSHPQGVQKGVATLREKLATANSRPLREA
ncbi:MAG: ribulose-phosphate 3-epimerase [Chloroflexi bacterium]|nr:ribulose-phosphate 3-epimerase [Chloroflexota bacterium]